MNLSQYIHLLMDVLSCFQFLALKHIAAMNAFVCVLVDINTHLSYLNENFWFLEHKYLTLDDTAKMFSKMPLPIYISKQCNKFCLINIMVNIGY